mgnify:CR=1 FL=1
MGPEANSRRYALLPQMKDYDRVGTEWVPYLMFINRKGFQSPSCNTDEHGFRHTHRGDSVLAYRQFTQAAAPKGLIMGGSLAFGVGASHDRATVASVLNQRPGLTWWNSGGRAFNSTQELLWFLVHLPKVDRIVLLSGMNNLLVYHSCARFIPGLGGFTNDVRFHRLMRLNGSLRSVGRVAWDILKTKTREKIQRLMKRPPIIPGPREQARPSFREIIEILERDLEIWRLLSASLGCSVRFCLQPSPLWFKKVLTREEEELFAILDARGASAWLPLSRHLRDAYPAYRNALEQVCQRKGFPFLDANELMPSEGWLFCDRVHLTDEGYRVVADLLERWNGS